MLNPVPTNLPVEIYIPKTVQSGSPIALPRATCPPIMATVGRATIDRSSSMPRPLVLVSTAIVPVLGVFTVDVVTDKYVVAITSALIVLLIQLLAGRPQHISCMSSLVSESAISLDRTVRRGDRVYVNVVPVGAL